MFYPLLILIWLVAYATHWWLLLISPLNNISWLIMEFHFLSMDLWISYCMDKATESIEFGMCSHTIQCIWNEYNKSWKLNRYLDYQLLQYSPIDWNCIDSQNIGWSYVESHQFAFIILFISPLNINDLNATVDWNSNQHLWWLLCCTINFHSIALKNKMEQKNK